MDLILKITAQGAATARAAVDGITGALRSQADQVRTYSATLRNGSAAFTQLLSGAAAILGIRQLGQAVRSAQEAATAIAQLRTVLQSTGMAAAGLEEALVDQASALELATGYADETVLAVQRLLFGFRGTADQVRELTPLVLDMASAMGTDPVAAAKLLGQALDGQAQGLTRYGITAKSFPELTRQVAAAFGGQAESAQRARGPVAEFTLLLENTREELGRVLLVPVNSFLREFNQQLDRTRDSLSRFDAEHPRFSAAMSESASVGGQLAASLGPTAVGVGGAALILYGAFRVLQPAINVIRVGFFALAGPLQQMTKAFGLSASLAANWRLMLDGAAKVATRFGAALSLAGGALSALGVAFAGFKLGGIISQIEIFGDTIENRLIRSIYRAQIALIGLKRLIGQAGPEDNQETLRLMGLILSTGPESETGVEGGSAAAGGVEPGPAMAANREILQFELARTKLQQDQAVTQEALIANLQEQLRIARDLDGIAIQAAAAEAEKGEFTEAHLATLNDSLKTYQEVLRIEREIADIRGRAWQDSTFGRAQRAYEDFRARAEFESQFGFVDSFRAGLQMAMVDLGTIAENIAATIRNTIGSAIDGISNGITNVIMGTMTWAQALRQIAGTVLNSVIQGIVRMFTTWIMQRLALSAVETAASTREAAAEAPHALLKSISSFGIAALVGAAVFAAVMAASGAFAEGGLVGGGDRLIRVNERGPEFVMNAAATARHLPLLESLNRGDEPMGASGSSQSRESAPLRVVIVDNRREIEELVRDPRFRSAVIDLGLA